jgi:hypothetical protein
VKILPEGMKRTSEYFNDQICREVSDRSRGSWRLGRLSHLTVHSDNTPVQNTGRVSERLREDGFITLVHRPNSPDLGPSDFFRFRSLRERLKPSAYNTSNELEDAIVRAREDIPKESLLDAFASWRRRLLRALI